MACSRCGAASHEELLDIAFLLPYDIAALDLAERARRAKVSSDLCVLKGRWFGSNRFFLRAVAPVPVVETDETLRWGVWVEVTEDVFGRYLSLYESDASNEAPAEGKLANELKGYPPARGLSLTLTFGSAQRRPSVRLAPSQHPLCVEQSRGISSERLHHIVDEQGLADRGPASGPRLMRCTRPHDASNWCFADPPNLAAFITISAFEHGVPILYAEHAADDGAWTFLDSPNWTLDDMIAVCLMHVVDLDPSLRELADLPLGWAAERPARGASWQRRQR